MASNKPVKSGGGALSAIDTVLGVAVVAFVVLLALWFVAKVVGAVLFFVKLGAIALLIGIVVAVVLKLAKRG